MLNLDEEKQIPKFAFTLEGVNYAYDPIHLSLRIGKELPDMKLDADGTAAFRDILSKILQTKSLLTVEQALKIYVEWRTFQQEWEDAAKKLWLLLQPYIKPMEQATANTSNSPTTSIVISTA